MKVSIVIPVLNEADTIQQLLRSIIEVQNALEIIVVDGGSEDRTTELAASIGNTSITVITAARGRATQMNAGAKIASGETLLFLHADTRLPDDALLQIETAVTEGARWGRFDVHLSGRHWLFRIIESMMNLRSRVTSVATGDQAIFVDKQLFERVGGFQQIPLMEDIALSKQLRQHARVVCIKHRVITSSRRWQNNGIVKTVLLMWWLRLLYSIGVSPERLSLLYY